MEDLLKACVLVMFTSTLVMSIVAYVRDSKVLETYCSTINAYNVSSYKSCKKMRANKILENLAKKNETGKEIVNLEVIK